jgi:DNA-binding beta-propeller fold protein YncE
VGYDAATDTLYVANAGDGSVRLFKGADLSPAGRVELGSDADNVRVDSKAGRVFIGYGDGALAIIDTRTHDKIASVPLKAHPESFQLDRDTGRIFVNVPNSGAIEVVDRTSGQEIASWPTPGRSANFAMALDYVRRHVLVAFRQPAELGVFSAADGSLISDIATCGDVDDLFVDTKRDRIYISCGGGFVDVLAADGTPYRETVHIVTAVGARTSLFVPELDRLLLAVPARGETPAAIWVFRPSP